MCMGWARIAATDDSSWLAQEIRAKRMLNKCAWDFRALYQRFVPSDFALCSSGCQPKWRQIGLDTSFSSDSQRARQAARGVTEWRDTVAAVTSLVQNIETATPHATPFPPWQWTLLKSSWNRIIIWFKLILIDRLAHCKVVYTTTMQQFRNDVSLTHYCNQVRFDAYFTVIPLLPLLRREWTF